VTRLQIQPGEQTLLETDHVAGAALVQVSDLVDVPTALFGEGMGRGDHNAMPQRC
jgi:hypothetical protein